MQGVSTCGAESAKVRNVLTRELEKTYEDELIEESIEGLEESMARRYVSQLYLASAIGSVLGHVDSIKAHFRNETGARYISAYMIFF